MTDHYMSIKHTCMRYVKKTLYILEKNVRHYFIFFVVFIFAYILYIRKKDLDKKKYLAKTDRTRTQPQTNFAYKNEYAHTCGDIICRINRDESKDKSTRGVFFLSIFIILNIFLIATIKGKSIKLLFLSSLLARLSYNCRDNYI